MKLITELNEEVQVIKESTENGEKKYFIEGIIMQADIKNRNGRVYPSDVLMTEMNRYNQSYVSKSRAYGELGHPDGPTINLDRVSHMFVDLRQEGTDIVGRAKIMDTPMGKIVKNFIDEEASLGISSRGLGSLKANKQGIMEVQSDFKLATAGDIVADPSAPNAFIRGIMEGSEWFYDEYGNIRMVEEAESIRKEVHTISKSQLEERKVELFKRFMNTLTSQNTR